MQFANADRDKRLNAIDYLFLPFHEVSNALVDVSVALSFGFGSSDSSCVDSSQNVRESSFSSLDVKEEKVSNVVVVTEFDERTTKKLEYTKQKFAESQKKNEKMLSKQYANLQMQNAFLDQKTSFLSC